MRRRPFQRVQLLRRILLALLILTLLGVGLLFWIGRAASPRLRPGSGDSDLGGEDVAFEARGFDHTVSLGERPLFRVRASRTAADASGNRPLLEDVAVTYFRDDGSQLSITSERGSYDLQSQAASLEGAVRVTGASGFALETRHLVLSPRSNWLASARGISFQVNDRIQGRARRLRANFDRNIFRLEGPVHIAGTTAQDEALNMQAGLVVYERDAHLFRAEREPVLRWGSSELRAQRVGVTLTGEEGDVESLSAHQEVRAQLEGADGVHMELTADTLNGRMHQGRRTLGEIAIRGDDTTPAVLLERRPGGLERRMEAPQIDGEFRPDDGSLEQLEASGGVVLAESRGEGAGPSRTAAGGRLSARLAPGGALESAELRDQVRFTQGGQTVHGDRAELRGADDRVTVFGDPARAEDGQRSLRAPQLTYMLAAGQLRGSGGVQATFPAAESVPLPGAPAAQSPEPLQVEAEQLVAHTESRDFEFTGRVQAWQGRSYLLAERLIGREGGQVLEVTGPVTTVWEDPAGEPQAAATEISGSRILHSQPARLVTYFGPVTLRQGPRQVRCERAEAQLDADDRARRIACHDRVSIHDAETGRTVSNGDLAIYDTVSQEIVVTGDPVRLQERDGAMIEGPRLIYHLDDGTASVVREGAPGEAAHG